MASTFGKSFGKSFNIGLQQAMQSARDDAREERLSARMKEEREEARGEALLKELGATGADVSSFRRQGGGYYTEAAEKELAEAQRQAIAGRAAAHSSTGGGIGVLAGPSKGAGASEGAYYKAFAAGQLERGVEAARAIAENERLQKAQQKERDRIEAEQTQLVSRRPEYANFPIDFEGDWRSEIAKIDAFNAFRLRQAQSGAPLPKLETEVRDLSADSFNLETGAMKSAPFIIPTVTPEMEGEFAEFNRKRVIKEGEDAAMRGQVLAQDLKNKDTMAKMASFTPSQLANFESLYGKGVVTSDIPILSHQISQSEKLYEKQYNLLEDIDKRNIAYYNEMAGRIPQGSTVIDPETSRPVPFVPRRDPNTGAYNREDIEVMKQSLRLVETGDSFNKSQNWVWVAKPPSLMKGGEPPVIGAVPKLGAGIRMPETLPPLEGDKTKDFWRGRGVTEHTYAASKNIFDAIGQMDGAAGDERYSFGGGDTVGGDNTKGATVSPLKGGIGAVNPAYESLFGAAMSRVKAQEFLMDAKVARIRAESQELNDKLPSLSARDSIILERKIKELKKNEVDTIKEQLKLRGLRNSLIKSTGN